MGMDVTENALLVSIGQFGTSFFWLACLIGIVFGVYHWRLNLPRRGVLITMAGLFLYVPVVLSSFVSENGGFSYKLFFFPLLIITVYLSPRFDLIQGVKKISPLFLGFIYASLISIFLNPTWAYSIYSDSLIGIPIRLFGVAEHPNSLGYLALFYLVLARLSTKKTFWWYVHQIAAMIVLILAQSKTAWAALIFWLILEWLIKNASMSRQGTARVLSAALVFALLAAMYLLLYQQDFMSSVTNYNITLTGRTSVWRITLDTWLQDPILGHGPTLWNLDFRQQYYISWAGQAHNQFLHTLGESGLIGVFGLLFYFLVLIYLGSRYVDVTNFSSLGLVIIILVRSFTESPFRNYYLDGSFLFHAILFIVLVHSESLLESSTKGLQINST